MKFLNEKKILFTKQFGFSKNFSTAHAIINLVEKIEQAIDQKYFTCGIFIDLLKKAFEKAQLITIFY